MSFDGEAFVQDLREELIASGRSLDRSDWVGRVVQGEATKEDLVGWAASTTGASPTTPGACWPAG